MEQLGALHGEVVRAHAGTSPCVVAGYSFQGKVVIEVARALQRLGGNLALVLLIDFDRLDWDRPRNQTNGVAEFALDSARTCDRDA